MITSKGLFDLSIQREFVWWIPKILAYSFKRRLILYVSEVVESTSGLISSETKSWRKSYRRFEDKLTELGNLYVIFVIFFTSVVD